MSKVDEDILFATMDYFSHAIGGRGSREAVATTFMRLGMALALRHPEYAQVYVKLTSSFVEQGTNEIEAEVINHFIQMVPLKERV